MPEPTLNWRMVVEVVKNYRVLSNDALIALAALEYGIETIISFDGDFDRILWLKRLY